MQPELLGAARDASATLTVRDSWIADRQRCNRAPLGDAKYLGFPATVGGATIALLSSK